MKEIILSADGESFLYSVPDHVADNLHEYCVEFCNVWLRPGNKDTEHLFLNNVACYNEHDFIEYLNKYIFPNQTSVLIKNLGWTNLGENLPKEYVKTPYFNF